jgi:NADH-quinone oxidoreductase subunit K
MLTTISINSVLNLTSILFFIGLLGVVLNRKNILTILMSIEILLLAVNLNFAALSIYLDDIIGQVFVIFILTIAAAESAIGLAIITRFYNLKSSIELKPVKKKLTNKL